MGGNSFLHDQLQPNDPIKDIQDVFDSENGVLGMNEIDREAFFLKLQDFLKQHKGEQHEYYSELPVIASQHPEFLVRRENPTFFVESLENNQPIHIVTQEGV